MIGQVVSGYIVPERAEEYVAWLKKLVAFANENYGHLGHVEAVLSMDGPARGFWVGRWDSLAAYEQAAAQWDADPRAQALVKEGDGLDGDRETHFYQIVTPT